MRINTRDKRQMAIAGGLASVALAATMIPTPAQAVDDSLCVSWGEFLEVGTNHQPPRETRASAHRIFGTNAEPYTGYGFEWTGDPGVYLRKYKGCPGFANNYVIITLYFDSDGEDRVNRKVWCDNGPSMGYCLNG